MTSGTPDLARIPAGEFLMGAADGRDDERPVHRVFLDEFFIGRFPVTHDEFARFIRDTGRRAPAVRDLPLVAREHDAEFRDIAAAYSWTGAGPPAGLGAHPVVLVTRDDALAYCAWLSDGLGRSVRLPTEAEWERAARGGTDGRRYPWGDDLDSSRCHFLFDSMLKRQRGTRPTGTFAPNGFGLCDMVGNVWEWVSDWYGADYYAVSALRNPRGPDAGTLCVVRGGAWVTDNPEMLRCSYRHAVPPDTYTYSIGFRVVCAA